jgi:hypothetical protein
MVVTGPGSMEDDSATFSAWTAACAGHATWCLLLWACWDSLSFSVSVKVFEGCTGVLCVGGGIRFLECKHQPLVPGNWIIACWSCLDRSYKWNAGTSCTQPYDYMWLSYSLTVLWTGFIWTTFTCEPVCSPFKCRLFLLRYATVLMQVL